MSDVSSNVNINIRYCSVNKFLYYVYFIVIEKLYYPIYDIIIKLYYYTNDLYKFYAIYHILNYYY